MNIEFLSEKVEKLESIFLNILYLKPEDRDISPDINILTDMKSVINSIFDDNNCTNVIFTTNTDKPFFGIRINPAMSVADATVILASDEKVKLNKYQIEFDSKLFQLGLSDSELAAITIYEISSMMDSPELFEKLRAVIDLNLLANYDVIKIRDSVNAGQLIIFALKDTLNKMGTFLYKETEEELCNMAIQNADLCADIKSAQDKVINSSTTFIRSPQPYILNWMFIMYKDYRVNSRVIMDTLKDAKAFSGSRLDIEEIDKTLFAVDRLNAGLTTIGESTSINKFFNQSNISSVNEISLFKSLKKNGLRAIENELYEFNMKVKNCTTDEDAYMIMRGINSRLGILEDYLVNEELSEYDRKHWEFVAQQYRELRVRLSQRKFKEKQYGLFFDYSKLDQLDN
jgi:hypothetical protein